MARVPTVRSTPPSRLLRQAGAAALLPALLLAAACGGDTDTDDDERPAELSGWTRSGVFGHADVVDHDHVAVAGDGTSLVWITWARGSDSELSTYLSAPDANLDGAPLAIPEASSLPVLQAAGDNGPVVIPTAAAISGTSWTAVATVHDQPGEQKSGLVAWQGDIDAPPGDRVAPSVLTLPDGRQPAHPRAVAGRVGEVAAIATLTSEVAADDPEEYYKPTGLTMWRSTGGGEWVEATPHLDLDAPLASIGLTGDGAQLVLAGVDREGRAHLWTSPDGTDWGAVTDDLLPTDVAGVGTLTTAAEGTVAIAWHLGDLENDPLGTFGGASKVQTFTDGRVDDHGNVAFDRDARLGQADILGVVARPDGRLVVAGAADTREGEDPVPMVWTQVDGEWVASEQPELAGRLDCAMRGLALDGDEADAGLRAVVTCFTHVDVEQWQWASAT